MHSVGIAHRPKVASALVLAAPRRLSTARLAAVPPCVGSEQQLACADEQQLKQAVLCTKFKAHDAAVTALAVLKDEPGFKQIVTTSLDKSLAIWTVEGGDLAGPPTLQCTRLQVAGGPVFSLQRGIKSKVTDKNVKPRDPVLFCGLAGKEITALRPDTLTFNPQMHMNGHTGWVRALTSSGKYLFSCGCNHLHQWDQAYAVPKEVRSMSLFTGDILALAATDKSVFTAGADGSLRRWALGKLGELCEADVRDKAHDGRITSLAVCGSLVFSAGYDGSIKGWDVSSLKLVMEVKAAHAGERVRALVVGPTAHSTPSSSTSSSPSSSPAASPAPSPAPPSVPSPAAEAAEAAAAVGDRCVEAEEPLTAVQQTLGQEAAAAPQETPQAVGSPCPGPAEAAAPASSPASSRPSSPSSVAVLYSAGDDGLVRRWDARVLSLLGEPLSVHHGAVKALAVGEKELLVSGDASGEVAVWLM